MTRTSYTADELKHVAKAFVSKLRVPLRYFEDCVQEFIVAALGAEARNTAAKGRRAYQHKAGEWAVFVFLRRENNLDTHQCVTFSEEPRRSDTEDDSHAADESPQAVSAEPEPLDSLGWKEERDRLEKAIRRLTPRQARVIRQFYFEGLSVGEIADGLGLKKRQTLLVKRRAIENLRDMFSSIEF